ncbi:MAG TPA: DNA polymerase III subunit gamma and tau [Streptosporangiaceae bacterium]
MAGDAPGTEQENPARPGVPSPPAPLALYRKYRPATFAEVRGQEHVTEPLRQALRNGRVHHAYLFSGPRGCGKTSSARILARSLNCEQGPTPDPCGVCASCVALAPSGPGSIDVIEIDAASHGGVDDARDLRERAFYAPVSGRFKIYIIDEAHMVTREGFNALLKLVEEPPPHLKFVFATTEPEKVIATIRSRTHHYPFRLVPPTVLRDLLEEILAAEGVSYQPAVLPLVVRAGAGSVRDALSTLDQLLAGSGPEGLTYDRTVALLGYTDDSLLDEMMDAFAAGNGAAVFGAVDRVVEGGHDPRRFAADLLDRLRDLIILAAVPGAGQSGLLDAPADRLERMAEQAGRFGQAELTRAAEIISEGLIQMRGTTSPRLLLELICAQVLLPAASTGEKALLARLERLEHQLAGVESGPGETPGRPGGQRGGPAVNRSGPAADRGGPAADQGGPAADQGGPAGNRGGSASDRGGPAVDRSGPAAGRRGPGQDQGEDRNGPEPGRDGPGPRDDAGQPGDAGPRGSATRRGDAGSRGDSGPREDAGRRKDAGRRDDPGRRHDHGPRSDATSPGDAASRDDASPRGDASPRPDATGPRGGTGPVNADALRQRWPEILDAVRSEKKVAWMLLNTASVQDLENGVLTIAFPSEGNARGFASSGHDQVLTSALAAMLGLNVRVRAVAGGAPAASPAAGGRAAQGQAARNRPAQDNPTGPPSADPPATTRPEGRTRGPGTVPEGGRAAGGSVAGGRQAEPRSRPASPPAAGSADEEWPDDASGPGTGAQDLTGMELIRRQLGGRVIQEIEDS